MKTSKVCREGNRLAYGLARRAILSADINVWVKELPGDLEDNILIKFRLPFSQKRKEKKN